MKLLIPSLAGLLVAGSVYGATSVTLGSGGWLDSIEANSTDNAYVRADVTPLSPKITGFITRVAIKDNERVSRGQVLFTIEDNDYRARVQQAKATLDGKRAAVTNLESRLAAQLAAIEQANAAVDGARADADRAAKDFTRSMSLSKSGTTTQASVDLAQSSTLVATSKVEQAKANFSAAKAQLEVIESQRPQLLADIDAAAASLNLAEIDLASTVVRAPDDGTVGDRQARVGQLVKPGTALIAFVSEETWIVANFKETQVASMKAGGLTSIEVDAVPGIVYKGRVESISPASGAQFALLPPDNATGNFTRVVQRIPVRITFDPGQQELDRLHPGMSAKVAVGGDVVQK